MEPITGLIIAIVCIVAFFLLLKHTKKQVVNYKASFEQVFAQVPDEQKVNMILVNNFFGEQDLNIKKLANSPAKIILITRDGVIVITDLVFYNLSPRGMAYKILIGKHPNLPSFWNTMANGSSGYTLALEQVTITDCYFSHDIISRFGELTVSPTSRNGFVHISTCNEDKTKIDIITGYLKKVTLALHQDMKEKTLAQMVDTQAALKAKHLQMWANGSWKLPVELFVKICEENGVTNISSERDYLKATIIVENLMQQAGVPQEHQAQYITRDKMNAYLAYVKKSSEAHAQAELQQQIKQLLPQEKSFEEECIRYAECIGRDKSIRYCEDKIAYYTHIIWQCEQNEDSVRNGGNKLYDLSKGRESSWAIHGGIANGIAGGAAGLAVAADVERKNVQIRQQNANLAHSIAQFQVAVLEGIWKEKRKAKEDLQYWNKEAERANLLLVQSMDEQKLLSLLHPSVKNVENSITGAVKLQIEVQTTPNLVIYEDVRAVVDGSIKVLLKVKGKIVGSALCSLKHNGAAYPQTIDCICIKVSEQADKYDVSFEPYHLWALERK